MVVPQPTDPIDRALWEDMTAGFQWFELSRREISPKRFK